MQLLNTLKLLLPALIPSWHFFDIITASPRIQYALLEDEDKTGSNWTEFRPRPHAVSLQQTLRRLFFNAKWNESLFLVSCAERILLNASLQQVSHSENEILRRISHELQRNDNTTDATYLQFRLVCVQREQNELLEEITYLSRKHAFSSDSSPPSSGEI